MAIPPPPGAPAAQKTSEIIGSLRPSKQFKLPTPDTSITSLSFDDTGEFLLAACSDESLQLYNAREGKSEKSLLSKKYGCHLARFTHHHGSIIYASTRGNDDIRYLSTFDNAFLRYFKGHTASVTSLSLCPGSDTFVSTSLDDTVRLWNLSSPHAHGRLNLATPTLAAYDPSATVLAVASPSTSNILLYDLRHFDRAPFATFDLKTLDSKPHIAMHGATHPRDWTRLEFSNDGKHLLLGTNATAGHILLDAFDGSLVAFLVRAPQYLPLSSGRQRPAPYPPMPAGARVVPGQGDVCFSADGRYVLGASGGEKDGAVWDVLQGEKDDMGALRPLLGLPCKGLVGCVEWNPKFNMLASGDKEVVMWLPEEHVSARAP